MHWELKVDGNLDQRWVKVDGAEEELEQGQAFLDQFREDPIEKS